ncbi:MAG TPA: hypothetical protein VGD43_23170 [Micromonospora sp.]
MPTDNNEVQVVLESLHAEAGKWRRLSDEVATVRADVERRRLFPSAFFFADVVSVAGHTAAYEAFHGWLARLLTDATTEFDQIGGALDRSAEAYAHSDQRAVVDLRRIYGTPKQ